MSRTQLTVTHKIYATSEERKQRNRQAQAAFRERRTEYIKQLESQIRDLTTTKSQLKENHDKTADECLMLRYKNSILEKMLQEKGIDVRLELQEKSGSSPTMNPVRNGPPPIAASPAQMPMQKAMMLNRQPQARWPANMQPKPEGVHGLPVLQPDGPYANRSPHLQPTATSQTSSPVTAPTRSPNFVPQGMIQSPNFGPISQPSQGLRQQPSVRPQAYTNQLNQAAAVVAAAAGTPPLCPTPVGLNRAPPSVMANAGPSANGMAGNASGYYQANFQSHMDQLDQEYDAAADMIDEHDTPDHAAGPGPYPQSFGGAQHAAQRVAPPPPHMSPSGPLQPFASPASAHPADMSTGAAFFGTQNHLFDPFDSNVDQDPFGLSASMHFPTQFTYESR